MSVTSSVTVQIQYSGDVTLGLIKSAADNIVAAADMIPVTLVVGNNTIIVPVIAGLVPTGLFIIPPAANPTVIVLKGVNADSGVILHKTNPTFLALDTSNSSIILSVATQVVGVQLVWT